MTTSLTLVIPCYQEGDRLRVEPFERFLADQPRVQLLFVDDGSTDATAERLSAIRAGRPDRIEILRLARNAGKGEAVRRGLLAAMAAGPDLVGFWDADLSTPLDLVHEFVAVLDARPQVEWVIGSRWRGLGRRIERNALRHYLSRVFATAVSLVLGVAVYDTQCGAKVFRANGTLAQVLAAPFRSRWIFDVEMLARLQNEVGDGDAGVVAGRVVELPLSAWRHDGRSHVRLGDFGRAAGELLGIWRRYRPGGSTRR